MPTIVGTAANLFLPGDYFPHQWTMIKADDIVLSSSLDEVLTDNKSFYNTGFYSHVFMHRKQNATRLHVSNELV